MNKVVIIDGDNMLHRAYHKFGGFTSMEGKPSSMIFGFPYMVRHIITILKPSKMFITFDGRSSDVRKSIWPDYRKREQKLGFNYEDFQSQKSVVKMVMQGLGIPIVWDKDMEADDLIYLLCRANKKDPITIVSGDKDFHQLIDERISVYSPNREISLTPHNLKNYFNYSPEEVVDYLCLTGDKSDKIPGYGGIGEVRARQFLNTWGSIKNYLITAPESGKGLLDKKKLKETYDRNRILIDLAYHYRKYLRKKVKIPYLNPDPILNLPAVASIARQYEVTTLTKSDFLAGFKDLFHG